MGEHTSLTVTEETLARFNDAKAELSENQPDAPDHSAESFLNALLDEWESGASREQVIDIEDGRILAQQVERHIGPYFDDVEDIKAGVQTIEERTGRLERQLEEVQGR